MLVRDACGGRAPSCHGNILLQKPGKTLKIAKFLENHEIPPNQRMACLGSQPTECVKKMGGGPKIRQVAN